MAERILAWWAGQLRDLVPERFRQGPGGPAKALVLELDGTPDAVAPEARLIQRRGRRETLLGPVPLGAEDDASQPAIALPQAGWRQAAVVLRLPAAFLLERDVTLPLAVERDPAGALRYEMDRLTPFRAEEVFWTWRILARSRGQLLLRLSLVARAGLRAPIAALERQGLTATHLEIAPPAACLIPLDAQAGASRHHARRIVAAGCAGLAAAAVALPFLLQARDLARLDAEIAALRPAVAEAEALRRDIAAGAAQADAIAAEGARLGNPLELLAALTAALPDDTHLTTLTLRQRQLTIDGRSASAARLLGMLAATPQFRDPSFQAPVTRAASGRGEVFSIRAELADP